MRKPTMSILAVLAVCMALSAPLSGRQTNAPPQLLVTRADSAAESADPSYGINGRAVLPSGFTGVTTTVATSRGMVLSVCLQSNGRSTIQLARLTDAGLPDSTFGAQGVLQVEPQLGLGGCGRVVGEDSQGRLVVAGWAGNSSSAQASYAFVGRLLPSGAPDLTFGGGFQAVPWWKAPQPLVGAIPAVAIDYDDGLFIAGGFEYTFQEQRTDPFSGAPYLYESGAKAIVVRLSSQGVPDPTFGPAGRWLAAHEPNPFRRRVGTADIDCDDLNLYSQAWSNPVDSLLVLPNRQLLLGGTYRNNFCAEAGFAFASGYWAARYETDRTPSVAWGGAKAFPAIGSGLSLFGGATSFSPSGHLLVAAIENPSGGGRIYLVNPDGTASEIREAPLGYSAGGRLAPDGTAMIATSFLGQYLAGGNRAYRRYLPNGTLDGWYAVHELDGAIIGTAPDPYSAGIRHFLPHVADAGGRWYGWSSAGFSRTRQVVPPLTSIDVRRGTALPPIAISVRDVDSSADTFSVTVRSSNQAVVADADLSLVRWRPDVPPALRTRWYLKTAAPRSAGRTTIVVHASDGINTTSSSFDIVVADNPQPPANLRVTVTGSVAHLAWEPAASGPVPQRYAVSYGTQSGRPTTSVAVDHPTTSLTLASLPAGRYYATVTSLVGALGSGPSAEVAFDVPSVTLQPAPVLAPAVVDRPRVAFSWAPPSSGPGPTEYVLIASLSAGGPVIASVRLGLQTSTVLAAPDGVFFVKVLAVIGATTVASNEIRLDVAPPSPPAAPQSLTSAVEGNVIALAWRPPSSNGGSTVAGYLLDAGSTPGASNLATGLALGPATAFTSPPVPNGSYYVRVRAQNAAGAGAPSNEVRVVVGPPPPSAPTLNGSGVSGGAVSLAWTVPGSGASVTGYQIHAGSAPGLSDIAVLPLSPSQTSFAVAGVPSGSYFVRVLATSGSGPGAFSNEVAIVVP